MKQRDFVSTLSAVAVCGVVLAGGMSPRMQSLVAVTADHRAQERTATDIDNVGKAMFSWLTDQVGAAAAGQSQRPDQVPASAIVPLYHYPSISHQALEAILVPNYLRDLPERDGWNWSYEYYLDAAHPLALRVMAIRSLGRDGAESGDAYVTGTFEAEDYDEDIVWADGYRVRWPRLHRTDHQAQRETVKDIDSVGQAMFSWLTDQVGFAADGNVNSSQAHDALSVHLPDYPEISHEDLSSLLVPQYLPQVPAADGWYHPYDYRLNVGNPLASRVMAIRSAGRDGEVSGDTYLQTELDPASYEEDIVWADGFRIQWPGLSPFAPGLSDHDKQKRTVAAIRNIGTAMFSWLTDQVGVAADEARDLAAVTTVHFPDYPEISRAELESVLVPQYINSIPAVDAWDHPYDFRLNVENPLAQQVMAVRSPGRDGEFSGDSYPVSGFPAGNYDEDLVWVDGFFIRWPEPGRGPVHTPYPTSFYTVPPCRAVDTRQDAALKSGYSVRFELAGKCGIPDSARAVAVNVTVANPTGLGYLTLYPGDIPSPQTSTINFLTGTNRANQVVLELSIFGDGGIGARPFVADSGQLHLIVDVSGYFE